MSTPIQKHIYRYILGYILVRWLDITSPSKLALEGTESRLVMPQLNITPDTFAGTHYQELAKMSLTDCMAVIRGSREYQQAAESFRLQRLIDAKQGKRRF